MPVAPKQNRGIKKACTHGTQTPLDLVTVRNACIAFAPLRYRKNCEKWRVKSEELISNKEHRIMNIEQRIERWQTWTSRANRTPKNQNLSSKWTGIIEITQQLLHHNKGPGDWTEEQELRKTQASTTAWQQHQCIKPCFARLWWCLQMCVIYIKPWFFLCYFLLHQGKRK